MWGQWGERGRDKETERERKLGEVEPELTRSMHVVENSQKRLVDLGRKPKTERVEYFAYTDDFPSLNGELNECWIAFVISCGEEIRHDGPQDVGNKFPISRFGQVDPTVHGRGKFLCYRGCELYDLCVEVPEGLKDLSTGPFIVLAEERLET